LNFSTFFKKIEKFKMADAAILNFDLSRFVRPPSWIFQLF